MTVGATHRALLSAGEIDYVDTGGERPTIVLLHGLLMDESLWTEVVRELVPTFRCVIPVLPFGAHRTPVNTEADLSLPGVAALVSEFLEHLDLQDVTLIGSDTGGAIVQLLAASGGERRVARIVLVSCDAFDNFPPGLTGKMLVRTGLLSPRLFGLFMQQLRLRRVRRLPLAFGWLTRRGDSTTRLWIEPILHDSAIRRDTVSVLRAIRREPSLLQEAAKGLASFRRPALVVWAAHDRVMPVEHGRRLAALLDARLHEVADSYTLISLDQPKALASAVREFLGTSSPPHETTAEPNGT